MVEVRGESFDQGDNYAQVTRSAMGELATTMRVEGIEDLHRIDMRCENTGTFARWLLTEARGDTFVEVEFGMDPVGTSNRIFDATIGRLYFRRWLHQSLAALERIA